METWKRAMDSRTGIRRYSKGNKGYLELPKVGNCGEP